MRAIDEIGLDYGRFWRHPNGLEYKVVTVANGHSMHKSYPVSVVYEGPNGKIWVKEIENFLRNMTLLPG